MEKVLGFSFDLARREPKILLPNILRLIIAFFTLTLGAGYIASLQSLAQAGSPSFSEMMNILVPYFTFLAPIIIVSIVVTVFLSGIYIDIVRQARSRKSIMLNNAFSVGKSKFLPILWTGFLEALIILALFPGLFLASFAAGFFIGGIAGVIVLFSGVIASTVLFLFSLVFFYEMPAVVVLENLSGLDALRRSYKIARKHFWQMALVMLIIGFATSLASFAFNSVPYVGIILSSLAGLFLYAWQEMTPAAFYYEYARKK